MDDGIAEIACEGSAGHAADEIDNARVYARSRQRNAVDAAQKRGQESCEGVRIEVEQRAGSDDPPECWYAQHVPHGGGDERSGMEFARAALRFVEHQQSWNQKHCGRGGKDHRRTPTVGLRYRAAEEIAQRAANRNAKHEERENARAFGGWKKIAEPAGCCRRARGFTDAHADTRKEQHCVCGGKARGSRQCGPNHDSPGEELFAACGIGDAAEGDADNRVNPDKSAAEQANLRVVKMELLAHRLDESAGDVAVVEIENVDGEEDDDGEPEGVLLSFLKQGPSMLAHRRATRGRRLRNEVMRPVFREQKKTHLKT